MSAAENPASIPFKDSFLRSVGLAGFSFAVMTLDEVSFLEAMTFDFEIAFAVTDAARMNFIHVEPPDDLSHVGDTKELCVKL